MDLAAIPAPGPATTPLGAVAPVPAFPAPAEGPTPLPSTPAAPAPVTTTQGATEFAAEMLANDAEAAAQQQAPLLTRPPSGFTASLLLAGQGPGSTSAVLAGNLVSVLPARVAGLPEPRGPLPARKTDPTGPSRTQAIAQLSNPAGQAPDSDGTPAAYQRQGEATAPAPPPTLDILD